MKLVEVEIENKETNSFYREARTKLALWLERAEIHGLSNIVLASNSFLLVFWILAFLGCFTYCVYLVVNSILAYYIYQTTVSISYTTETPAVFPAVTVCNLNPFNEQRLLPYMQHVLSESDVSCVNFSDIQYSMSCTNKTTPYTFYSFIIEKIKRIMSNSNLSFIHYLECGFTYQDMVLGLIFS